MYANLGARRSQSAYGMGARSLTAEQAAAGRAARSYARTHIYGVKETQGKVYWKTPTGKYVQRSTFLNPRKFAKHTAKASTSGFTTLTPPPQDSPDVATSALLPGLTRGRGGARGGRKAPRGYLRGLGAEPDYSNAISLDRDLYLPTVFNPEGYIPAGATVPMDWVTGSAVLGPRPAKSNKTIYLVAGLGLAAFLFFGRKK